jgi:folate-dependent phosphoribosylglycinamide formyltransferase PurN
VIEKVSLLLGYESVPVWFADAVAHAREHTDVEFSFIVVRDTERKKVEIRGLMPIIRWLVRGDYHYKPVLSDPETLVHLDETDALSDLPRVTYTPVDGKNRTNVPESVVNSVTDDSDLVVQWGSGILTGQILTEPEYGVWNFHHSDTRVYRGTPAGFWEFVNDEDEAGVTLIRLNEDIDTGAVVDRRTVEIGDLHRWHDVQARLYQASESMLSTGIKRINEDGYTPKSPDNLGPLYTRSDVTLGTRLRYLSKAMREFARRVGE